MDKKLRELIINHSAAFGPNRKGSNILVIAEHASDMLNKDGDRLDQQLVSNLISGFDMATQSGPLCDEPMMGVCFIV